MRWFFSNSSSSRSFSPNSSTHAAATETAAAPTATPLPPTTTLPHPTLPAPAPAPAPASSAAAETSSSSSSSSPRSRSTPLSQSTSASTATTIIDLSKEYTIAVQTSSYTEIWDKLHQFPRSSSFSSSPSSSSPPPSPSSSQLLDQILHPNHHSIHQALQSTRPTNLTRLVSAYFDSSEHTSHLCLLLQRSIDRARYIYAPLHDLLQLLSSNSPAPSPAFSSLSQLDCAFSALSNFDRHDNPFPSLANFHDMRRCFSDLRLQLDRRLRKARHRVRVARRANRCSAICLIGTAVGVAVSAAIVATHALAAIVAAPFFTFLPTTRFANQQLEHIAQLDAAARGTYVLNNDLDTIDRLVARLHATVESDKLLVRLGLQRGKEMYPIQEVLKQLQKNQSNFLHQLKDLEEHVCLCFAAVNRARSLLLQQMYLYQTRTSDPSPHFCFHKYCTSPDSLSSASDN
ncbi:hypothetical protein ACLOJK_037719 [Asimina triloba]